MSKIKALLEKISTYTVADRNEEVREVIKDKTIPLEERWSVYTKSVDSGYLYSRDGRCFVPPSLDRQHDFTLYDSSYVDRYQTYCYIDLFLYFEQDGKSLEDSKELVDTIKEEIMETGNSHWENDW